MLNGYIIRLAGVKLSEDLARDCIEAGEKHGVQIEPFAGINGHVADPILESLELKPFKVKSKASKPGVKGCFLSHYFLWKKCVTLNHPIAIFEHDGLLMRDVPKNILDRFDDVLNLDPYDQFSNNYEQHIKLDSLLVIQEYNNPKCKPNTLHGEYLRGAYAYIIKPHAAQNLIDSCHKHGYLPADHQIGKNLVKIQTTFPNLARLHPHYSIEGGRIKADSFTRHGPPIHHN